MRDDRFSKIKKIIGAFLSSLLFGIFLIAIIAFLINTRNQFTSNDNTFKVVYYFLIFIFGVPLISIIINLISRIKEILGGEEDEASKY